ncbi:hypothetical protein EDC96DRAFT_497980 [Choanephora cucurbitarum]|nr:hypothetical protein EDC96DRAFT_497980 [Choanephora cucurbitarum]
MHSVSFRRAFCVFLFGRALAYPMYHIQADDIPPMSTEMYIFRFAMSILLVLAGGFFAGLTLGLMGLDETNLQVMCESGSESEKKNAKRVLELIQRGKYWVLVTLLLSNVIVNETLPIVLDSIIGGGLFAILLSTALIVIFGEVIPQSICVRYGLAIGAKCSPIVLAIMYLMYPIVYPTSLLLGYFLGESKGTVYKKEGLKSLVTLHQSDDNPDGLTEDEVHIITSVLDLREKSVSEVMIPIKDVFTLPLNAILDKSLVQKIVRNGYSRIPIRKSEKSNEFAGMLLVKQLISYDVDDELPVSHFELKTLLYTSPDTSCLDILNLFQEGKSHMALVSKHNNRGDKILGVVTLEDVLESLIGEVKKEQA